MKLPVRFMTATVMLLPFTSIANTATPLPDPVLDQLDAAQQHRQTQQQEAQAAQLQSAPEVRLDTAQQGLALPDNESPCYPIHRIVLTDYLSADSTSLSQFQWALLQAFKDLKLTLPHCLGGEGLGVLMKQTQNNIIEKGYVTTRVVAEEQDLRSGTLVLTVIPGKIGQTIVADSSNVPRFTRLQSWTGLTFSRGEVLNVREIEQSLENLKRVPTVEANIEILPSETGAVGESDLKISYQQALPFRFNLSLDDSGSRSTGKYQGSATLSIDNIFSANDLFYTSFTHSLKSGEDDAGRRASKNLTFYYSIPFGYWTLSANQSYSRYHQEVFAAFDNSYIYAGESNNSKLTLAYLLYRDAVRKTTVSGSVWSRQSKNFIDGEEVEVQKRRMAGWEAGITHKEYLGNATLELAANFKRGTGGRGALAAPEELWNEGTSRPKIITMSLSLTKPFQIGVQQWQWQSSWQGQWNKTRLIAQDRWSIGGRHTVRGFDGEQSLFGERGWVWRNELAWHINRSGHQLYWALDSGRVSAVSENQPGHHLVGMALGVKGSWKGVYYDLFVGKPLHRPKGFRTSDRVAGFQLGYSF
ncbi:ShlB/FhaC/HecB family hemolysin secretion/activation protein [Muribacter muris]|uniref:ShlB/FhaC/HecB family hemolysin secretion/activation protein n=1 Tax=Muribacter muris TaxID=67855 RepID=A0A4Y9JSK9_9PAST|nr:ShlB/FhaC/HecB family hemolysin secretion/activation protein [Muribacter muris]MBF0786237.1 ShlB/FhaC/HecB family hemolysin secretion/activation protein [Muribacter muris]MBF0826669.1 ShlB/FhaC/HecB family hemolysin secretion/activation protein [Muribacter muris]TFV07477.1 ShlB/FhaC/HecB family hemolysin secretion/activation protein [Muribacter muris]